VSFHSDTNEANFSGLLRDIAMDCEAVAQELHTRLYNINAYLRLNVERGLENITIENWSELGGIESHTGAYIAVSSVSESIDTSLRHLREKVGAVTLGQVSKYTIVYSKSHCCVGTDCVHRSITSHQSHSKDGTSRVPLLRSSNKSMDKNGLSPRLVGCFSPEDLSYHWNGRLWEDTNGILLSTGEPISVSTLCISSNFI
jgi:hypothetical protein